MSSLRPCHLDNPYGFASTHWTTVRACIGNAGSSQAARETLCRDYWYPVYAYVRRLGHQDFDAADLTQDFFAEILRKPWFEQANEKRGRFRSFLLASLNNFIRDKLDGKRTVKRGGKYQHIPLDLADARSRYAQLSSINVDPTETYEIVWATSVVDTAWKHLEAEYTEAGKSSHFVELKVFLTTEGTAASYDACAERLCLSAENVKVSVHRMRKRYGAILREEVVRTVVHPGDVQSEMLHVRDVFAQKLVAAA